MVPGTGLRRIAWRGVARGKTGGCRMPSDLGLEVHRDRFGNCTASISLSGAPFVVARGQGRDTGLSKRDTIQ
jgi:hypothetical protein